MSWAYLFLESLLGSGGDGADKLLSLVRGPSSYPQSWGAQPRSLITRGNTFPPVQTEPLP